MSPRYLLTGRGGERRGLQLNVSQEDIVGARERLARGDAQLMAVRCRADRLCGPEKMARFRSEFGTDVTIREYGEVTARNSIGGRPHALYTKEYRLMPPGMKDHYAQAAFDDLIRFLGSD